MARITKEEAVRLIKEGDLKELGLRADAIKKEKHPENITTFIIDRNINYTNVCWVDCKFCAFYRHEKDEDAYVLTYDEIDVKIDEMIEVGGTQILFQGGVHPKLKIEWYEDLVAHIHGKYPDVNIHGFSAIEINYIAKISKIDVREVLQRLKAKGMASMPGAGAEILSNRVTDIIAKKKMPAERWVEIHKIAHEEGIKTTATMMYGTVETDEEIVEHLDMVRQLQDITGGFRAFILWSFQASNTQLADEMEIAPQSSNRYLRLLAVSRIFLDNVPNLQSSWVTQGGFIGQMALQFGANDLGSTMMEENVVKSAGASFRMGKKEMIHLIKDIGSIPAKRNTNYDILEQYA